MLTETTETLTTDRATQALRTIRQGIADGAILNVVFQDAKATLDRAAETFFKASTDHFWHGTGGNLDQDKAINDALNAMVWGVRISYARDAISAAKKLAKVKLSHPMVDAYRAAVAAILPLAHEMAAAKALVVKGRRPNPEAEARKAARLASVVPMARATCGCCFGDQAVLPNGKIHDHGYMLRGSWNKTASCYGRAFRPLEVSDEGPRFMVEMAERAEAQIVADLAITPTTITTQGRNGKLTTTTPADADWTRRLASRTAELESELRSVRSDLETFRKTVADWKKV